MRRSTRSSTTPPPSSFTLFWPYYLKEHRRPLTRAVHVIGTAASLTIGILGAIHSWGLKGLALSLGVGYGPAWASHFFYEGNRPASFKRPVLSFIADLRMAALFLSGRLEPHLRAAGV